MAYGFYSGSDGLIIIPQFLSLYLIAKVASLFGEDGIFILGILIVIVSIPILIKIIIDSGGGK
tara:strand:+ start:126 stop:314 length:189 start_codon:yes stop_codon:yes gene_type:complete